MGRGRPKCLLLVLFALLSATDTSGAGNISVHGAARRVQGAQGEAGQHGESRRHSIYWSVPARHGTRRGRRNSSSRSSRERLRLRCVLRGVCDDGACHHAVLWHCGVDGAVLQALHPGHHRAWCCRLCGALPNVLRIDFDQKRHYLRGRACCKVPHVSARQDDSLPALHAVRALFAWEELFVFVRVLWLPPTAAHPAPGTKPRS